MFLFYNSSALLRGGGPLAVEEIVLTRLSFQSPSATLLLVPLCERGTVNLFLFWACLYYFLCNQRTLVYVILSKKNIVDLAYVKSYVLMYFCLKLITMYVLVPKTYCIS